MFSINIPYPDLWSRMRTWVTAPTSLPFRVMGLPLRSDVNMGQQNLQIFTQSKFSQSYMFACDSVRHSTHHLPASLYQRQIQKRNWPFLLRWKNRWNTPSENHFFSSYQYSLTSNTLNFSQPLVLLKQIFTVSHSTSGKSILCMRLILSLTDFDITDFPPDINSTVKSFTSSGGTPILCCFLLLSDIVIFMG